MESQVEIEIAMAAARETKPDSSRAPGSDKCEQRSRRGRTMKLNPYQRDALRLVVRDFHRPDGICADAWHALRFGEASEVRISHLDVIAQMNPNLYSILRFWRQAKG
jgi:hypothetical protein